MLTSKKLGSMTFGGNAIVAACLMEYDDLVLDKAIADTRSLSIPIAAFGKLGFVSEKSII